MSERDEIGGREGEWFTIIHPQADPDWNKGYWRNTSAPTTLIYKDGLLTDETRQATSVWQKFVPDEVLPEEFGLFLDCDGDLWYHSEIGWQYLSEGEGAEPVGSNEPEYYLPMTPYDEATA